MSLNTRLKSNNFIELKMESNHIEEERYYRAQKRVEEIKQFYQHLTVYLLCNPIVIAVNLMTSPEFLYFWWSLLGWGMAVVLHGLKVFNFGLFFNKEWEDKKVKEFMEKEKPTTNKWE